MRKILPALLLIALLFTVAACGTPDRYDLTEKTFFYGMTVILDYPTEYTDKVISFDCFTYRLTDVNGKNYLCGVRKCSSEYGCNCGKDTVIGFILDYDGEIPEPKNQSDDTPDKSWIHVEGKLASTEKEAFRIYAYKGDEIDYSVTEPIAFYHFAVSTLTPIEDYSGLAYFVTK